MITTVYYTWRADFFDRIRRRNYLVSLMCMAVLTMLFFPNHEDVYATVVIGGYRGIYNSAWIGASLAILNVFTLPIICFYLVKNAVERDRDRGISELIAATSVGKFEYILGKWFSNLTLLIGLMLMMSLTSIFVQLWHGEDYTINLLHLLLPQLFYVVPMLAAIAAAALLFETIPILRGGIGNVVYFFLWIALIVNAVDSSGGIGAVIDQIQADVMAFDPQSDGSVEIGVSVNDGEEIFKSSTFSWSGIKYDSSVFKSFGIIMGFSVLVLLLATAFFDRFKKAKDHSQTKAGSQKIARKMASIIAPASKLFEKATDPWSFTRLVRQEFLLLIRGSSIWWYLMMMGLAFAQLVAPIEAVVIGIVPATWILSILVFSPMGHRELQQGAAPLIFSCPSPIKKQFPAMLVAGSLVALMLVGCAFARFLVMGEFFSALMLLTGALFISSFALACGALTRTSRTFEILFTVLWYMGPVQRTVGVDFVGVNSIASQQANAPLGLLIASLVLIAVALQGKRWQMG
jgi:hypothetical protein